MALQTTAIPRQWLSSDHVGTPTDTIATSAVLISRSLPSSGFTYNIFSLQIGYYKISNGFLQALHTNTGTEAYHRTRNLCIIVLSSVQDHLIHIITMKGQWS
jgi:hypothetical protein